MTNLLVVCRTCGSTFEALKILPRDHLVVCPACRNVVGKYYDLQRAATETTKARGPEDPGDSRR